jgi:AraC-like DNA-binding protein
MNQQPDLDAVAEEASVDESTDVVRAVYLQKFTDLVTQLGGDADLLVAKVRLDPAVLDNRQALIPYRTLVHLLERASEDLECPDFGMRLAAIQGEATVLGPLGIAMRNAPTVGEALRYSAEHVQVYSRATQVSLEQGRAEHSAFMRLEIILTRLPFRRQAVEQALLLIHQNLLNLSGGQVHAREIWFTHEPLSPLSTYRDYFGAPVSFGRNMNGLLFAARDLDVPIVDRDPQIYKLATSFVEHHFPSTAPVLSARVRAIVERQLPAGDCTLAGVAAKLGMHPRTLQRRLRADGECFEEIKDGVRRDIALRYIKQSSLPLMRVAEILGYSETSVLSRSCYRWFSASPRELRAGRPSRATVDGRGRQLEH